MAGTYTFSGVYIPPGEEPSTNSLALQLDTGANSDEAAADDAATRLHRMQIKWLHPLAKADGPWKVNQSALAVFFQLHDREWLTGEALVKPIFDRVEVRERQKTLIKFIFASDGPLRWTYSSSGEGAGWTSVDRLVNRLVSKQHLAITSDEFQAIGLLCRDIVLEVSRTVYDTAKHPSLDGKKIGPADSLRMLAAYFTVRLAGERNEYLRAVAKSVRDLANHVQHDSTSEYVDAALCARVTISLVDLVRILEENGSRT